MHSPRFRPELAFSISLLFVIFLLGCGAGHGGGHGGGGTPTVGLGFAPGSTSSATFLAGSSGTLTLIVDNIGTLASSGATTVTFSLLFNNGNPTGVTFNSNGSGGSGWDCSGSSSTNVSCTTTASIAPGASAPTLTVAVNVSSKAAAFATNPTVTNAGNSNNGQQTFTLSINLTYPPNMTISMAHVGANFVAGTEGKYSIAVTNAGAGAGSSVKVTDTLPTGLTFASSTSGQSVSGSGGSWTCTASAQTVTCTLASAVNAGAAATPLTLTVSVALSAPATISNTASVTATNDSGTAKKSSTDTVSVGPPAPVLSITKTHSGNFTQAQTGATYTVTITNAGSMPTSGLVTVTEQPPGALTVTAMVGGTGSAWACTVATLTCTRSDALAAGSSYDPITVTVNVAANTPTSVTNQVAVSGGGSGNASASDPTTINTNTSIPKCPLPALGEESLLDGIYAGMLNGWVDPSNAIQGPYQMAGAWHADGSGGILFVEAYTGEVVAGSGAAQKAPQPFTSNSGCYNLGPDLRGLMIWEAPSGNQLVFAIAVRADGTSGRFLEFDDSNPSANPGTRDAGSFEQQTVVSSTNAPVAFALTGYAPNGSSTDYRRSAAIGVINTITFGSGQLYNGVADVAFTNDGTGSQVNFDNIAFRANFSVNDSLGGGGVLIEFSDFPGICGTPPCPLNLNFRYYMGAAGHVFLQSTDTPDNNGYALNNGEVIAQTGGAFSNSSLSTVVFQMSGADLSSNHGFTDTAIGRVVNSSGAVTVNLDEIRNGSAVATGTNAINGGSINISSNGMGTISFGSSAAFSNAPAAFSVAMYGPNAGFLMEGTQASVPSPSTILLGDFGPQTVPSGGFVDGTLSGVYILGTDHPASTGSIDTVGSVSTPTPQTSPASFSGKSNSSSGAGCTTNCLATDQTISATYAVDADGRFPITFTSPGAGSAIGWLLDDKDAVILSDPTSLNPTTLKALQ